MSEKSAASSAPSPRLDVGELVRQVSEILAAEQPLAQSIGELCTLLTHAFGARSVAIALDDGERAGTEYRYDMPLGLVGSTDNHAPEMIPLQIGQRSVGSIKIVPRHRSHLTSEEAGTLETCARYIAVGLRNARLAHANEDLERLIEVDALTEVGNRRRFDLTYLAEWRRCMRNQESISIVMVDVDFFKELNDRYGHIAGDDVLRTIARAISQSTMRASDVVTRYGGEEFAVILPETDLPGAVAVAENVRMAVQRMQIPHAGTSLGCVSVSAGVATATPKSGDDGASLVEAADLALYRAKTSGRNRIVAGSYISEGPPVERRAATGTTNLPIPLTTFLGRRNELSQIDQMLMSTRICTLVGPGGVGKTRLALELAALHVGEQSVTFVDLAAVVTGENVAPAIASALGVKDEPGHTIERSICDHLQKYGGLIILDNCEHLLVECTQLVEEMLASAPGVTIVATSREPLGIRGEGVYRIPSLDVPPEGYTLAARDAMAYDAIHLFVDRAKLVDPAFELRDDNVRVVTSICRRLDGIPLAIELATPRLRMMTLAQIEKGLDARFDLLTGGGRMALPRQKTLGALIRWGYDLLSDQEQRALADFSILVGRWTVEAASAVVGLDLAEVLDLITSLVDKSLLIAEPRGEQMRYRSPESTRAFALGCLQSSGRYADVAGAHARYFYDVLCATIDAPERDDALAFETIRKEYDNIQAALQWSLGSGNDISLGVDLVEKAWTFWQGVGNYRDAQRYFECVLQLDAGEARKRRFAAYLTKALMNLGDAKKALGYALPLVADCATAQDWTSLHLARRMAASAYFELNQMREARDQVEHMLAEPCPGIEERALSIGYLACIEMRDGNVDEANRLCAEALRLDVSQGLRSWTELYSALALFLSGKTDQAIEHAEATLAYEESVQNDMLAAFALVTLAWCRLAKNEIEDARDALRRALHEPALARRADLYCKCFEGFAILAEAKGEPARAGVLLGFAQAEAKRRHVAGDYYARTTELVNAAKERACDAIGVASFNAAMMRGAWLSTESAIAEASQIS